MKSKNVNAAPVAKTEEYFRGGFILPSRTILHQPTLRLTYRRRGGRSSANEIIKFSQCAERKAWAAVRCRRIVKLSASTHRLVSVQDDLAQAQPTSAAARNEKREPATLRYRVR